MATHKTKLKILDAAEGLFADRGFNGVSLREIADAAGVRLGHVWYHFRSKEDLFVAIFERRLEPINQERIAQLERVIKQSKSKPPDLEAILDALIGPIVRGSRNPELGGMHFARLIAQTLISPETDLVHRIYTLFDNTVLRFQEALALSLPGLSHAEVQWGYHFTVGAFVYTMANPGRLARLSHDRCDASDAESVLQQIIPYTAAGLRALLAGSVQWQEVPSRSQSAPLL